VTRASHDAKITAMKAELNDKIAQLEEQLGAVTEQMSVSHKEEMGRLRSELESSSAEVLETRINELTAQHASSIEESRKMEERCESQEDQIKALKEGIDRLQVSQANDAQRAEEQLCVQKAEAKALRDQHQLEVESIRDQHQLEVVSMLTSHAEQINAIENEVREGGSCMYCVSRLTT